MDKHATRDTLIGFIVLLLCLVLLGLALYGLGELIPFREWLDSLGAIFQNVTVC